jgi:hypothetical protein
MDKYGLEVGTPDIKSVGPITFGPEGILFVADNAGAAIFAIDVGDDGMSTASSRLEVDHLDARLAAFLGCGRGDVAIRDMAVHPSSRTVYLSVMRGSGLAAVPLIIRVEADGSLSEVPLENVPFSQMVIDNAPAPDDDRQDVRVVVGSDREGEELQVGEIRLRIARDKLRTSTVTDMAWIDGLLLVAGASNEEFSSALRRIAFPFNGDLLTNSLEIYHVSHGQYETASPIRTFVPYGGNTSVLASYTCTPVVHISLTDIESGTQAKGRTVAELGAMNQPLDMISYEREGEEYLLVSNTRHPLIRIACRDIDGQEGLTAPKEPVGVPRDALAPEGVTRMANLGASHVLMMQRDADGELHLHSYDTAAL